MKIEGSSSGRGARPCGLRRSRSGKARRRACRPSSTSARPAAGRLRTSGPCRWRGPATRIVARLQQRPPEDRHQLRELGMYAGAVQALVVVLPEHLPVALDELARAVTHDQRIPICQASRRLTGRSKLFSNGGGLGVSATKMQPFHSGHRQAVEAEVAEVEVVGVLRARWSAPDRRAGCSARRGTGRRCRRQEGAPSASGTVPHRGGGRCCGRPAATWSSARTSSTDWSPTVKRAEAARLRAPRRAADVQPVPVPDLGESRAGSATASK